MALAAVVGAGSNLYRSSFHNRLSQDSESRRGWAVDFNVRGSYEHLQRLSADFYQVNRVGEVTARLTHDVNRGIRPLYFQAVELLNGGTMLVVSAVCLAFASLPLLSGFSSSSHS